MEGKEKLIYSSIDKSGQYPIVLVSDGFKYYVGSYAETEDEDLDGVLIKYPVLYSELIENNRLVFNFNKVFHSIPLIPKCRIKYTFFMSFDPDDNNHSRMADMYEKVIQEFIKKDAGIITPTTDQINNISKIN